MNNETASQSVGSDNFNASVIVGLMGNSNDQVPDGIIEIRDPEINVQEIMSRIRENMAHRKIQGISLNAMALSEERLALRAAHEHLKLKVHYYGTIGEPAIGWKGKIQFFFKRVIRRLIQRHIDQEREVQEAMLRLIERLIPYLDQAQYSAECIRRIEKLEQAFKQNHNL